MQAHETFTVNVLHLELYNSDYCPMNKLNNKKCIKVLMNVLRVFRYSHILTCSISYSLIWASIFMLKFLFHENAIFY